jgi:hypothetical protein
MAASVGCKEDAPRNSTNHSEEWVNMASRKFIKSFDNSRKKGISNFRMNQNAMRVIVGSTEQTNITSEVNKNAPHQQPKAEAFKRKTVKIKCNPGNVQVTTKTFSNKKFEKIHTQGLNDLADYHKSPNAFILAMKLKVDVEQALVYIKKQLQVYKLLLDFKINRLPENFRPYAKLHYRRAYHN